MHSVDASMSATCYDTNKFFSALHLCSAPFVYQYDEPDMDFVTKKDALLKEEHL